MNNYENKLNIKQITIIALCFIVMLSIIGGSTTLIYRHITISNQPAVIQTLERVPVKYNTPVGSTQLTREEFAALQEAGLMQQFETYENYTASGSLSSMEYMTAQVTADGVNRTIYDIADSNFNVWYGEMRVSPIVPMAISNVETPGRADHSITWSSLFPSKIVPIDYLETFDVTSVISNQTWYQALSSEYSTRDRGCLQMSPTYGTGNSTINAMMSGTEKDKLAQVDTSDYAWWVSGASDQPGDRFYLPDVCLRMTGAMQAQTQYMLTNDYVPKTDMQLVAMLIVSHHNSGVWCYKDHNKSVGAWRSGQKCYDWCEVITQQNVIDKLTELAMSSDQCFIDSNVANQICTELGINNYSEYSTKSIVCTYPIKALYAYIKLCILYTS